MRTQTLGFLTLLLGFTLWVLPVPPAAGAPTPDSLCAAAARPLW